MSQIRGKFLALRSSCHKELRAANRDERLAVATRCFRGDMAEQRELVRKQQAYARAVPGVTEGVRKAADQALSGLLDALATIINAVDSGVFRTTDIMLEARHNLREKFQIPAWGALATLRADRSLTATAQIAADVDATVAEERANAGEERAAWTPPRQCLWDSEVALQIFVKTEATKRKNLSAVLTPARDCIAQIQAMKVFEPQSGTGSSASSSSSGPGNP